MKIFQLISVCFLVFQLNAQNVSNEFKTTYGLIQVKDKNEVTPMAFFKSENGYIGMERAPIHGPKGYNYYIETYDENLKSISVKNVSEIIDEDNYNIKKIIRFNNKFIIQTSRIFKNEKREEHYLQLINPVDGSVGERQLISNLDYTKKNERLRLVFSESPNEKKLLVTFINHLNDRGEQKIGFILFDSELNLIWKKESISLMVENRRYDVLKTVINDNDEVYLLGKNLIDAKISILSLFANSYYSSEQNLESFDLPLYSNTIYRTENNVEPYEILSFKNGKLNSNKVKIEEIGLIKFTIEFGKDNILRGYGYYSDDVNKRLLSGVFSTIIDPNSGEISALNRKPFSNEILKLGLNQHQQEKIDKKAAKGDNLGIANTLQIKKIVLHDDGSQSFVGEIFYITVSIITNPDGTTSYKYHYIYEDLVVTRISKDGEITNINKVRKHNIYSSQIGDCIVYNINNKLAAIFPDHRKRYYEDNPDEYKNLDSKLTGMKNTDVLTVATVSTDGEINRNCVLDYYKTPEHQKDKALVSKKNAFLLENSEIILGCYFKTLKKNGIIRIHPNE